MNIKKLANSEKSVIDGLVVRVFKKDDWGLEIQDVVWVCDTPEGLIIEIK